MLPHHRPSLVLAYRGGAGSTFCAIQCSNIPLQTVLSETSDIGVSIKCSPGSKEKGRKARHYRDLIGKSPARRHTYPTYAYARLKQAKATRRGTSVQRIPGSVQQPMGTPDAYHNNWEKTVRIQGKTGGVPLQCHSPQKGTTVKFRIGANSKIFAHAYSFPCPFYSPNNAKVLSKSHKNSRVT